MEILICTHGRHDRQITYANLPAAIQQQVKFVVQHTEQGLYRHWPAENLIVLPPDIETIQTTRQWLQWNLGPKICMLDDDLVFARRRADQPTKFTAATPSLELMFCNIENALDEYAHVGVSHREGANRNTDGCLYVGRMMRVLAYRTDIVRAEGVVSDRIPDLEDFDVTLQLLRRGYPNCILNWWVHNQSGSNQAGGCSTYRTPQTHDRDVRVLAELHAPFVKVVKKKTKDKWCADEKGERTDVTIQWKKAYLSSGETDVLDARKVRNFRKA